jgi:transposase
LSAGKELPVEPSALFPHLASLRLMGWQVEPAGLVVDLASPAESATCSTCGQPSASVHSHYRRSVADLPLGGRAVTLRLHVRRFRCRNLACPHMTFVEDLSAVVARYARQSIALQRLLADLGITVGGRPGARFAHRHAVACSRSTLLRLVRRLPLPPGISPRVLGVDDFALRRNHHYGTLVVDLERHRLLDLWPERTAASLVTWLEERQHPPELVCRDRGGAYADGARQAAPNALQVADRFHLARNAGEVLERVLVRHASAVRRATTPGAGVPASAAGGSPKPPPQPAHIDPPAMPSPTARRARRLARYHQVMALHQNGWSLTAIAQQVGLSRPTVRKYVHADAFPEWPPRRTPLHAGSVHTTYLQERWAEGCHDASILWTDLRARGFTGSLRMVQRAVAGWRPAPRIRGHGQPQDGDRAPTAATTLLAPIAAAAPVAMLSAQGQPLTSPPAPRGLSPQQAVWLLLRPLQALNDEEQALRTRLLDTVEDIRTAHALVERFRALLQTRGHACFAAWLEAAATNAVPELRTFAASLRRDEAAVRAALMVDWSSGQVEGQVTKVKLVKRLMFGRANFDLLRRRVLLAG